MSLGEGFKVNKFRHRQIVAGKQSEINRLNREIQIKNETISFLRDACERMIKASELWLPSNDAPPAFRGEVKTLTRLYYNLKNAVMISNDYKGDKN